MYQNVVGVGCPCALPKYLMEKCAPWVCMFSANESDRDRGGLPAVHIIKMSWHNWRALGEITSSNNLKHGTEQLTASCDLCLWLDTPTATAYENYTFFVRRISTLSQKPIDIIPFGYCLLYMSICLRALHVIYIGRSHMCLGVPTENICPVCI